VNDAFPNFWQYALGSIVPFPDAAMSLGSQLKKQYDVGCDSNGAQSSLYPALHSPETVQQSASVVHVCVQYPFVTEVRHVGVPWSAAASMPG
jgi:hypothetical protein